ncbi:ABC transporter permease [Nocardia alni]|uniref:ABC transporter permease n=1 Tax=Nocardia alni TaxID=2815723 RepID=UPI001C22E09C|nr:ABC transporter permease [Nocardia alni]
MRQGLRLFLTATRYGLVEHARNRFAMLLVAVFVPAVISLVRLAVMRIEVSFRLRGTGVVLRANGNELAQISAAIAAVTLIIGFMMFAATFGSGEFDRRLSMAGFPRVALGLAKIACLVVASVVVSVYATAILCCYWSPRQPVMLAAALFCAAMTYGALGVVLGTLLRREVEGMFAIAMISCVDMAVQNPIASIGADGDFVRWLPSFGAMQVATAAGFSGAVLLSGFGIQLVWFAASVVIGLVTFHLRTRSALRTRVSAFRIPGPVRSGDAAGRRTDAPRETYGAAGADSSAPR